MKDTDFLFLTAMLRAREAKMLSKERIERMLDSQTYDDAAKMLSDCGYPDMSGMSVTQAESVLAGHRFGIFSELSGNESARPITDMFRMKYDYHNVKVLVKAMAANEDASAILSEAGRVGAAVITEAFISGERQSLPVAVKNAMGEAVGIMSRTKNPQLADIFVDKAYFSELLTLASDIGDSFTIDYVRLLIDSANLRTFVRALRVGRDADFLRNALIPGGNTDPGMVADLFVSGSSVSDIFTSSILQQAVQLGAEAVSGGGQTAFELACDNAVLYYISDSPLLGFGPASVVSYLTVLEWEITAVRMILTGKRNGIAPDIIRERLRDCYV